MPFTEFPNPLEAGDEDIVALGGDLHPETLMAAYREGIFPWPMQGYPRRVPMTWFCPCERAILEFDRLRVPRSLAKARRRLGFTLTHDRAFDQVILECAKAPRPGQDGTWLTPDMIDAYRELHRLGHAHSVEAWSGDRLVGGIYGIDAGGAFSAESMFYLEPYASKIALLYLMELLRDHPGWIDIQQLTPHMEALGARNIPRPEFIQRWKEAQKGSRYLW